MAYGILAALLSAEAFGIYAVVASVSFLVMVFRDAGVRDLLIAAPEEVLRSRFGSFVLTAVASNLVFAAFLVAASNPVALFYGSGQIRNLLWFVAGQLILGTGWSISSGLLRRDLRFADVAVIETVGVAIQFVGAVALAAQGLGAASLVIPLPVAAAVRSGLGIHRSRHSWSHWASSTKRFDGTLAKQAGWVLLGAGMLGLLSNLDYLVFGRSLSKESLGIYFFGFQVSAQIFTVVASVVLSVSLPKMARAGTARMSRLCMTAAEVVAAGSAVAGAAIIVVFPYLDRLAWAGRWSAAYPVAALFALTTPLTLLYTVNQARLAARNQWRSWAFTAAGMAAGLAVVSLIASSLTSSTSTLALCVGMYLAFTGIVNMVVVVASQNLDLLATALKLLTAWAVPFVAAGIVIATAHAIPSLHPLLASLLLPLAYGLGVLAIYRVLSPELLTDLIDLLPTPISDRLRNRLGIV